MAKQAVFLSMRVSRLDGWIRYICDCAAWTRMHKKYPTKVSNNRTASIKSTYWKTRFHIACKEGQFDVVELMAKDF